MDNEQTEETERKPLTYRENVSPLPLTVREAGRRGGAATRAKYGPEHYAAIGAKGGKTTAERYGSEHYSEIGRKGGRKAY